MPIIVLEYRARARLAFSRRRPVSERTKTQLKPKGRLAFLLFILAFAGFSTQLTFAARAESNGALSTLERASEPGASAPVAEGAEEGLSQKAVEITRVFGFP